MKPLTHAFENFFLFNLEDTTKERFVTELNKEFPIYDLITFSSEKNNNNKLNLISLSRNLKFQLKKDVYEASSNFKLEKVHTKKSYNVVSDSLFNFGLLRSKKN